jgi:hypothetical protein
MIISHLMGGLGNQMFEYAAGLALARRRRTVLKLDTTFYHEHDVDDRHYSLDCFNVNAQFATAEEIQRLKTKTTWQERALARMLNVCGVRRFDLLLKPGGAAHYQKQWTYYPEFWDLPDHTYLHGNFMSEKFFAPVADLVRHQFTFRYPPTPAVEEMAARIKSGPSVAVHFRRGDYLPGAKYEGMGVLVGDYYNEAMASLRRRVPGDTTYYLFSDDIEAIEREYKPAVPHVFVKCCQHANYYDKIRLMQTCDHNIIANSTFSWWAAWLNPNPDKIVIAPRQWFAKSKNSDVDVVPEAWLRI